MSPDAIGTVRTPTPLLGVRPEVFPVVADDTGIYLLHNDAFRDGVARGMTVRVEVFPVVADEVGVHLVSEDAPWTSGLISLSSEPDEQVKTLLAEHLIGLGDTLLVHSTWWRVEGNTLVLTYLTVIRRSGRLVRNEWPRSRRVVEPSLDRAVPDVLAQGLCHLRFLLDTDGTNRVAFDEHWRAQLLQLRPVLAGEPGRRDVLTEFALNLLIERLDLRQAPLLLDATSWRPDLYTDQLVIVVSHVAVIPRSRDLVYAEWPWAQPITQRLLDELGRPIPHSPIEPPNPSRYEVLLHALRGLHFRLVTDPSVGPAFDRAWRDRLGELEEALVCLYDRDRRSA